MRRNGPAMRYGWPLSAVGVRTYVMPSRATELSCTTAIPILSAADPPETIVSRDAETVRTSGDGDVRYRSASLAAADRAISSICSFWTEPRTSQWCQQEPKSQGPGQGLQR